MTSHCPSREPSNILAERHSQHLLPPPARRPTIPSIRMVNISIIPPNFLLPHSNPSLLPLSTLPFFKQLLICFLSIQISLYFIKIYINGIISLCSFRCYLFLTQQNYCYIHLCCINSSFLFINESYSMVWTYTTLFIHSPVDEYLGCFYFFGYYM